MAKANRNSRSSAKTTDDRKSTTQAWNGALTDELIYVTRIEVEAREDYEPDNDHDQPVELRRWLRVSATGAKDRTWLFDFEVASPLQGSPYRFLVHLLASIKDGDLQADSDEVANAVMVRLSARLYAVAGEQLFAATVRGPWGPLTLPPQGPQVGRARRMSPDALESSAKIVEILETEGPMLKEELSRKVGGDFDDALKVARIQGLIEEDGSTVFLRSAG
jgi:hypothetical protein